VLPLFYIADMPMAIGERVRLVGGEGNHAAKVLRLEPGDETLLSDGRGNWSQTVVEDNDKKSVVLRVVDSGHQQKRKISITVVQAVIKADRRKENMELLVESGVDRIVPWQAARSIAKLEDGVEKLQIAAREASKQARRYWHTEVTDVVNTRQLAGIVRSADFTLLLDSEAEARLTDFFPSNRYIETVVVIIGPEGGITSEEMEILAAEGAQIVKLGRPILRSAHAGMAAVAALSVALGLW
jgi:16S rRNA (uracil1498-N3)-methyltransferase